MIELHWWRLKFRRGLSIYDQWSHMTSSPYFFLVYHCLHHLFVYHFRNDNKTISHKHCAASEGQRTIILSPKRTNNSHFTSNWIESRVWKRHSNDFYLTNFNTKLKFPGKSINRNEIMEFCAMNMVFLLELMCWNIIETPFLFSRSVVRSFDR